VEPVGDPEPGVLSRHRVELVEPLVVPVRKQHQNDAERFDGQQCPAPPTHPLPTTAEHERERPPAGDGRRHAEKKPHGGRRGVIPERGETDADGTDEPTRDPGSDDDEWERTGFRAVSTGVASKKEGENGTEEFDRLERGELGRYLHIEVEPR
jgi:hypothetical protein